MAESLSGVTQRLANLIGAREAGKIGADLSPTPLGRAAMATSVLESRYQTSKKIDSGRLTKAEIAKVTQSVKGDMELTEAIAQGRFEKEMKDTPDDVEKAQLQRHRIIDLTPIEALKEIKVHPNAKVEKLEPLDVVHEIANFENRVFDSIAREILKEKGLTMKDLKKSYKDETEVDPSILERNRQITVEAQVRMDKIINQIGLDSLRGYIPGPIGKHFRNKVNKTVEKYASPPKK